MGPQQSGSVLPRIWKPAVLLFTLALIVWRAPNLFAYPRIWAEEGAVYLSYAINHGWWQTLIASHQGYYSLWPNLATLMAAKLVPLHHAAVITTLFAFLGQLIPLALALWGKGRLWSRPAAKAALAGLILLTPATGEVWLNSINNQFFWAISGVLLLTEDLSAAGPVRKWIYRGLLALCALNTPLIAFMAPLFILRAVREKSGEAWVHAALAVLAIVPQGLAFLATPAAAFEGAGGRLGKVDLPTIGLVLFNRTLVFPFAGRGAIRQLADYYQNWAGGDPLLYTVMGIVALALLAALLIWLSWGRGRKWLIGGAYAIIAPLTVFTAMTPTDWATKLPLAYPIIGERYFFAPAVFLMLLALANVDSLRPGRSARSAACAAAVATVIIAGAFTFKPSLSDFNDPRWPRWRNEVIYWEKGLQREIRVWPPPWKLEPAK